MLFGIRWTFEFHFHQTSPNAMMTDLFCLRVLFQSQTQSTSHQHYCEVVPVHAMKAYNWRYNSTCS